MKSIITPLILCAIWSIGFAADPEAQPEKIPFTAEQAKDALLRYIRANRSTFIGDPDPEILKKIPVKAFGEDRYSLGAFQFDLAKRSYSVSIGNDGPAPYLYDGKFIQLDGKWTAAKPTAQHFYNPTRRPK